MVKTIITNEYGIPEDRFIPRWHGLEVHKKTVSTEKANLRNERRRKDGQRKQQF